MMRSHCLRLASGPRARAVEEDLNVGRDERGRARVDAGGAKARLSRGVSGGRHVDAGHVRRPSERRVEREPARVREEIEHAAAAGQLSDASAVLALIEERAGLLPSREIDDEWDSVLLDLHGVRRHLAPEDLEARCLSLRACAKDERAHAPPFERRPERVGELADRVVAAASPSTRATAIAP